MANDPVPPRPLPFNIPTGVDALKARDAKFWDAIPVWREAENAYNDFVGDRDGDPHATVLLDQSTKLLDALLSIGVRTAIALSFKLEIVREAYMGDMSVELPGGFTVGDVIRWDCERLAKFEMFGPDAFEDMAQG